MLNRLSLVVLSVLTLCRANAWNAHGHMLVAQIAYNHLDPAVRTKCDSLIGISVFGSTASNSNFVTAACWADDIKSQTNAFNIWHYIDIPFSLDGTSTNGVGAASFDVVRAINLCVSNLASSATSVSNQAFYLRFLLHFVGDVQQPLHASTAVSAAQPAGDGGGNSFNLTGTYGNLHSLWDAGGGYVGTTYSRPLSAANRAAVSNEAAIVDIDYPFISNQGFVASPATWAIEGWYVAQTNSYVGVTNGTTPTSAYMSKASSAAEQRLAFGGHRLADLLNTIYSTNGVMLASLSRENGKFAFSWNSVPGRAYRLQRAPIPIGPWSDVTNFVASTNVSSFIESLTPTQSFYRAVQ